MTKYTIPSLVTLLAALADEHRMRILAALRQGELCVCQIQELLGLAGSTLSQHLSMLRRVELIEHRKQGRWIYYRLPKPPATHPVKTALAWLFEQLDSDPRTKADAKRLLGITRMTPDALCCRRKVRASCCGPSAVQTLRVEGPIPRKKAKT